VSTKIVEHYISRVNYQVVYQTMAIDVLASFCGNSPPVGGWDEKISWALCFCV